MTLIGEWTTVDKTGWGPGPWNGEPDKIHWIDEATDLDCLMHRGPGGHWCGYVAVAEGHPFFEMAYDELPLPKDEDGYKTYIDVHGGLTFASFCHEGDDPSRGICHVPQPGRPDRVWWFGFDCAHSQDLSPAMVARERAYGWSSLGEVYRDRAYVESEVRGLARQLAAVSP